MSTALVKVDGGKVDVNWMTKPFGVRMLEVYRRVAYMQKGGTNAHFKYKFLQESALKAKLNQAMQDLFIVIGDLRVVPVGEALPTKCVVQITVTLMDALAQDGAKGMQGVVLQGLGAGTDSSDKAPMKACVAAFKFALANGLAIETGDEPEGDEGSERAARDDLDARIAAATTVSALNLLKPDVAAWKGSPDFDSVKGHFRTRMEALQGGGSEGKKE